MTKFLHVVADESISGFMALALLLVVTLAPVSLNARDDPEKTMNATSLAEPEILRNSPLKNAFGQLPLYFIENRGQMDERVAYYIQGHDKTLYFTSEGMTLVLTDPMADTNATNSLAHDSHPQVTPQTESGQSPSVQRWAVKLDFVGANPNVHPVGQDQTAAIVSYFHGAPDQWHTGLPTYARIIYPDLWPGIDLIYFGTVNQLKYEFVIRPGSDSTQIRLAYRGTTGVTINATGQLVASTPVGQFYDDIPVAFQETQDGQRINVTVAYALDTAGTEPSYSFHLGNYDPTKNLVLDPAVLVYCGYIGGSDYDSGHSIAVDSMGNAYITGETDSTQGTFPVAVGPDLTYNGGVDAFVVKINATGTALLYAGYIGGSDDDAGYGVAVDSAGNAYITGSTGSSEATFPVTVGPDLAFNGSNGKNDAFVAKIKADGTGLIYCGYIGGIGQDGGYSIAVDKAGNAYVTGRTSSTETSFPVSVGPDLTYNGGSMDAFVAKVKVDGTGLVYCGYIGGSGYEEGWGIAADSIGNTYVTGYTSSFEATFPVTVGPDLTYNGGAWDAFVAKISGAGTGLTYAGYIGGSDYDRGHSIAIDESGNAYITGQTQSSEASFPISVGPYLTYSGGGDTFVAKVNATGTTLVYCGYIGGSAYDSGTGVAVDGVGNAYIVGQTESTESTFPITGGPDLTHNGNRDVFVAKVTAAGTGLVYAGYVGGAGGDFGFSIAIDSEGSAYITGRTVSTETSFPVSVGPDLTFNGYEDAFVAKISAAGNVATYSISGRVTDGINPVFGVTVLVTNNSATTDANGGYILSGLIAGTYTVTPLRACYTFSPPTRSVSVPPRQTNQDFAASPTASCYYNYMPVILH